MSNKVKSIVEIITQNYGAISDEIDSQLDFAIPHELFERINYRVYCFYYDCYDTVNKCYDFIIEIPENETGTYINRLNYAEYVEVLAEEIENF